MDITYLYNPIATASITALVANALVLVVLVRNRVAIGQALATWRAKLFTRMGFFWAVNIVFMGVSVLHAGAFFGIAGKDDLAHYLGFAVSFFLDLVTIILMQAMLEARYRGEGDRAGLFLFFITVCCGTSTFANLAISLNDFDPTVMLHNAPNWIQAASPWVLASFPLFVIMMSIAAEMIINVRPLEQLDEQEYEADEKKRLKILEIRNTYLQKQADEELRVLTIRAQMKMQRQLRKGKLPGSFRWFWEKPANTEELTAIVATQLKTLYEPQLHELQASSNDKMQALQADYNDRLEALQSIDIDTFKAGLIASLTDELKAVYEPQLETLKTQLEDALSQQEDDLGDVFKRPIELENWRFKEGHSDEISAYQENYSDDTYVYASPAINPIQVALEETSPDLTQGPITGPIGPATSYSQVVERWLAQGVKSVSVEDIVATTNLSSRKVMRNRHRFSKTPKNENLYTVKSVLNWLKEVLQEMSTPEPA